MEKMKQNKHNWPTAEEFLKWAEEDTFRLEGEYGGKWSKEDTITEIKRWIANESKQGIQNNKQGEL